MRRENYFSQDKTEDDDVNALGSVTLKKKKLFLKEKKLFQKEKKLFLTFMFQEICEQLTQGERRIRTKACNKFHHPD